MELLKSVLSSIPLYFLSFFRLPRKVLKVVVGIQRSFMWGGAENKRGIAWVKWSIVCKPKECGGLGVTDLDLFNKSLLGKWEWRMLLDNNACWCDIIKSRYGIQRNMPGNRSGIQETLHNGGGMCVVLKMKIQPLLTGLQMGLERRWVMAHTPFFGMRNGLVRIVLRKFSQDCSPWR